MTDGIGWILEAQQKPLSPATQELAQNAIIAWGEQQMRFLVWVDGRFIGFRPTRTTAQQLVHEQLAGTAVYVCDPDASPSDSYSAFCMVAGMRGSVGPLPFELRHQGLWLAKHVLAENSQRSATSCSKRRRSYAGSMAGTCRRLTVPRTAIENSGSGSGKTSKTRRLGRPALRNDTAKARAPVMAQ
jgi:hypothetical protein